MKTYKVRAYLVRYYMDFKVQAKSADEAEDHVNNYCDIVDMIEECCEKEATPTIETEILEDE